MGLKNESGHLLLLFILCASIMLTISWPVMGSHDKKANSKSTGAGPEFPDAPLAITDRNLGSSLEKYSPFGSGLLGERMQALP